MAESRDTEIFKLFGTTIQLPATLREWPDLAGKIVGGDGKKDQSKEPHSSPSSSSSSSSSLSLAVEDRREEVAEKKNEGNFDSSEKSSNSRKQHIREKPTKQPAKLLIPCPGCNCSATKFCYYNNYNINQPRHFCKNCQRYWTAGGTKRNVPVGSGRRKTKPPSSGNHHLITITDDRRIHNETVLSFGPNAEKIEEQSASSSKESNVNLNFSYPWISFFPATYLGKHSRNEEEQGMKKSSSAGIGREQYYTWLSNPKKQRIEDPAVGAAKSSLLAALGLNNECDPMDAIINGEGRAGLLKSLSSKGKQILQANPAALSRTLFYHESSRVSRK